MSDSKTMRGGTRSTDAAALRRARDDDAADIAAIWRDGWREAHLGQVPDELAAARTAESFESRARARVGDTIVAITDRGLAGFVMVVDDEVEQVYVAAAHRGTHVAGALLAEAERLVAEAGHGQAWLAVIAANARARGFYERNGWRDEGPFVHAAPTATGAIPLECHRYVKPV